MGKCLRKWDSRGTWRRWENLSEGENGSNDAGVGHFHPTLITVIQPYQQPVAVIFDHSYLGAFVEAEFTNGCCGWLIHDLCFARSNDRKLVGIPGI
jgi:hypothetical protein